MNTKKIILPIFMILLFSINLSAGDSEFYFYKPNINYGSESLFNPISLLINGTFDILRNSGHNKNIFEQEYSDGYENVFRNISNPIKHINNYGWKNFSKREIFSLPMTAEAAFLPNIGLHTIGNGMLYARLSEWYEFHNVSHPSLIAFFTTSFYQVTNESIENESYVGTNVDPIADILIFNPLGILLFNLDPVKKFFSSTCPIYDWSLQPVINPQTGFIQNTGLQYTSRIPINSKSKFSIFFNWGISSVLGGSYRFSKDQSISVGMGGLVNKLEANHFRGGRFMSAVIDNAIGIYYDKNNSLLASALITGPKFYNIRLNFYPGLFSINNIRPGIFLGIGELDELRVGVTVPFIPIGFLTNFKK